MEKSWRNTIAPASGFRNLATAVQNYVDERIEYNAGLCVIETGYYLTRLTRLSQGALLPESDNFFRKNN
jgi:hypothetical protein